MGKRNKKKNKVQPKPTQGKGYTYRRKRVFCTIELFKTQEHAFEVEMRKPRSSRTQDLRNATPNFQRAMILLGQLLQGEEPDIDDVMISGSEIEEIAKYMAENTIRFTEPICDDDGAPLTWAQMDAEERVDFWETLPSEELRHAYGAYLGEVMVDQDPELRKQLQTFKDKAA